MGIQAQGIPGIQRNLQRLSDEVRQKLFELEEKVKAEEVTPDKIIAQVLQSTPVPAAK